MQINVNRVRFSSVLLKLAYSLSSSEKYDERREGTKVDITLRLKS